VAILLRIPSNSSCLCACIPCGAPAARAEVLLELVAIALSTSPAISDSASNSASVSDSKPYQWSEMGFGGNCSNQGCWLSPGVALAEELA